MTARPVGFVAAAVYTSVLAVTPSFTAVEEGELKIAVPSAALLA